MPQDAFTLRYLCKELNSIFSGGKVNRIVQPSNDEIVLTVYTGKKTEKLYINVNPSAPRIGVIEKEEKSPLTAPNFCMLLRKHLLSAQINSIEIVGFDRIVKIEFALSGEFFDNVKKIMYVELMGRYSNVILTENGKVLGGNRGINMFDDGVRPLIVGKEYVYPPVGQKKEPIDKSLMEIFDGKSIQELADAIIKNVQGIALSTAQEIVSEYLNKNQIQVVDGKDFFNFLSEFLFNSKYKPCVYKKEGQITDVLLYPYGILSGEFINFDTLFNAEEFYFSNKEKVKKFTNKKERLTAIVNTAIKKVKKRLTAITAKEKDADSAEENRIKGELILSNIYKIKQGQKECEVFDYYANKEIKISLNEFLSPSKNAENYYKKYNKQKRTLTALKPQRETAENELNYFNSLIDEISLSENIGDLLLIEKELLADGLIKEQSVNKNKKVEQDFYRNYVIDGYTFKVGRNNVENDKLTFSSRSNDLWFHAKDYHSAHAILENNGKSVSDKILNTCSEICAYYSKGRESGKGEIVYTERKNVKKPPRAKLGFVIYENYKSIIVKPDNHVELIVDKNK